MISDALALSKYSTVFGAHMSFSFKYQVTLTIHDSSLMHLANNGLVPSTVEDEAVAVHRVEDRYEVSANKTAQFMDTQINKNTLLYM